MVGNGNGLPCKSSGCWVKWSVCRGKWVELSQAQVCSLGKLGTGIMGSFLVSNDVEKPDSMCNDTASKSTKCIGPLRVNDLGKLTKTVGHAIFMLKEEMGYSVKLNLKEGWPVSIFFILSCFWKRQDKLVSTNFDGVQIIINVDRVS